MDSQIDALLTSLLNQKTPYSLKALKTIFTPHALWLDTLTDENTADNPVKRLLHTVYQHINQWDTLLNAVETKPQELPAILTKEEKKQLQRTITQLKMNYETMLHQIRPMFLSL